jgi:tRNA (cytidine/uridine-2'-O-)-methyltransferase
MRLVLFQPDIPQNLGAAVRIAACFETPLEVIEPCGFPLTDKGLRRAAMDYANLATIRRHSSWRAFEQSPTRAEGRLILFSTGAAASLWEWTFMETDLLLFGRESAGVPPEVKTAADAMLRIPISAGTRSLNVAVAAGIGLAEARRQLALAGRASGVSSAGQ